MIADATTIGPVSLVSADLERTAAYWTTAIGLAVLERGSGRLVLGAGDRELVRFRHVPEARPVPRASGLFHVALLVPERRHLGAWLEHAIATRVELSGASDHTVSEAIYLRDPDHHGIEIYADRPRPDWEGRVERMMGTLPLDGADLLAARGDDPFDGMPAGTVVGHVHLQVAQIDATLCFYRDVLGFGETLTIGAEATFLAAGGYHHHLGANTWRSRGQGQAPAGAAALEEVRIDLPDAAALADVARSLAAAAWPHDDAADGIAVRDPAGNPLLLAA